MSIQSKITQAAKDFEAEVSEKKGVYSVSKLVAERKAFLSRKKLMYKATIQIDEAKKELKFSEYLKESGFGLGSGDMNSPGIGFSSGTYSTNTKERSGKIEEQSDFFGKKYEYKFNFAEFRDLIKKIAKEEAYDFVMKLI